MKPPTHTLRHNNTTTTRRNRQERRVIPPRSTDSLFPLNKQSQPTTAKRACSNGNKHAEDVRLDAFSNPRCRLHSNSNDDEHNSPASANSAHRSALVRWLAAPRSAAQRDLGPLTVHFSLRKMEITAFWFCSDTEKKRRMGPPPLAWLIASTNHTARNPHDRLRPSST